MILVYGGAFNGKLDFAKEKLNITDNDIFDFENEICESQNMVYEVIKNFKCLYNTQILIKNIPDISPDIFAGYQGVLICDDMSCGIVPLEKEDRIWRENVSRFLTAITKNSNDVYRVFLGIPNKIK